MGVCIATATVAEVGERLGCTFCGLIRNGPWFARDAISSGPIAQMASSTARDGRLISLPMQSQISLRNLTHQKSDAGEGVITGLKR